jgi:hypothetical protein
MPLYATAPPPVSAVEEVGCSCAACRFGHGAGRSARPRRYTTDMTHAEWQVIAPLLRALHRGLRPAARGGVLAGLGRRLSEG